MPRYLWPNSVKFDDQTLASMNVQQHAKNQYNNLTLSENTGNLLFQTIWESPAMTDHIQDKCHDKKTS